MNLFKNDYNNNLYANAKIIYRKNNIVFRLFPMPTCCQLLILKVSRKLKSITKTQICILDNLITDHAKEQGQNPTTVMIDKQDKHMYPLYEKLKKINSKMNYIII